MRPILGTRVLDWWLEDHPDTRPLLARTLHIDKSTLCRALAGDRGIGDELMLAICLHLTDYARRPGAFFAVDRNGRGAHHPDTTPPGESDVARPHP
jgi:hypothetical protein